MLPEKQHLLKLKNERKFLKDLLHHYKMIAVEFKIVYSATGKVLNLNDSYHQELESLLKKNYRGTSQDFDDFLRKKSSFYGKLDEKKRHELDILIASTLLEAAQNRAKHIAPKIIRTSQEVLHNKTMGYIAAQAVLGKTPAKKEVAENVSKQFKKWGKDHAPIVATTETQTIAETSKKVEADGIGDFLSGEGTKITINKKWCTAEDANVRPAHAQADGQSVSNNEPFEVDNEKMMFPADTSLGASLSNIINCRCSAVMAIGE